MLAKYTIAALAGSAMLAGAAFAQTPSAATTDNAGMPSAATFDGSALQGNWRASKLAGLNVYNNNNESVGSINDLLTDKNGNIKAVVLGVGGFLGVGEHLVAVPFDKVKFVAEPVAYTSASAAPGAVTPSSTTPSSTTTTGAVTGTAPASSKPNPWYPDHAMYNATKDELKALPEFKYSAN
jgi:sporulation protein YlmC with PRC-barrel domain